MSQGEKPTHYVALKNKADVKNKVDKPETIFIADAWESQYGFNLAFRKEYQRDDGTKSVGVAAIKLTDGTIIKPDDWHMNLNAKKVVATGKSQTKHTPADEFPSDDPFGGTDEIPF